VKKLVTIVARIVVGLVVILVFALTVQWLFFGSTISINVFNRWSVLLHDVAVIVPGSAFSGSPQEMPPSSNVALSAGTQMFLPIRLVFDAEGHHYDICRWMILPPIGAYIISIYIDQQMQVSIRARILW
jgi:hypothetical protein